MLSERSGRSPSGRTNRGVRAPAVLGGCLALLLMMPAGTAWASGDKEENSCITCHSDHDLLVRNKKLFEYFQNWTSSVHRQEGVDCDDCHGGNPELWDKEGAHGGSVSGSNGGSAVNFRNIPETCGQCHDDILDGFKKSEHFAHLVKKKQEEQGPTCVTCHGSINVEVLNVSSVRQSCARCHNEEKQNHPENPEKAELILNRFLSIHRFYRYISKNATADETRGFYGEMEERLHRLSVTWHTFDLERIDEQTKDVLAALEAKRNEVRSRKRAERR